MAFARKTFELEQPADKGATHTKRQHYEKVQESKRKRNPHYKQPELEMPDLPESLAYLWAWFQEVANGQVLTWVEIEAWSRLRLKNITSRESFIIRELSIAQAASRLPAKKEKEKPKPPK